MANDFSGDSDCVAVLNEDSGFLYREELSDNDAYLTEYAGSGSVGTDTTNKKQGSASASFVAANTQMLYRTDANLAAGFPLKSGGGTTFSITQWIRPAAVNVDQSFLGKSNIAPSGMYFRIYSDGKLYFCYLSASHSPENMAFGTAFEANKWYHVGITYDSADLGYRIRIWDDTAGALLGPDATGSFAYAIEANDGHFVLAYTYGSGVAGYTGNIDEVVVFKKELTADEIDEIRAGTFGPEAPAVQPPVLLRYEVY